MMGILGEVLTATDQVVGYVCGGFCFAALVLGVAVYCALVVAGRAEDVPLQPPQ